MISNNLSNSITIENSESIQFKNNNTFKNINNTNKNQIYRFNSKSNEMKNNVSNQQLKEQSQPVSADLLQRNIFINILRNIASTKLSQQTNDNGILMPLFMSFNIFIVNSIWLCYSNLVAKELRTDLNILYPISNGFLNSIALTLIAWAESGGEIDGPTNSGLYLLYFPVAAMMKSQLLDRQVSVYTWINIAILMGGVQCIVRFNFKNIKVEMNKEVLVKKRFKNYLKNNDNNPISHINGRKLDVEHEKYVKDEKSIQEKYDKQNYNASKITFDNDDIGQNDNIDKNYEEKQSLSRFEELNKFKKGEEKIEEKEKPIKGNNKDVKIEDFDYDVSKFLNKNNSGTQNENEVRFQKITAKAIGVILLCLTYQGTYKTFKQNSQSVSQYTVIQNLSTLIFISIQSLFIISQMKMKQTNIVEIITARFYQQFFGFYSSQSFKIAQMSKYAWITTLTTNLSQFQRIQICRAGVLGFGGSWGFVISPFIFGSEFVMQNKKKDLNAFTLIGCILITIAIRLEGIMSKRITNKIQYMGAMEQKRANGNQLDFT